MNLNLLTAAIYAQLPTCTLFKSIYYSLIFITGLASDFNPSYIARACSILKVQLVVQRVWAYLFGHTLEKTQNYPATARNYVVVQVSRRK